MTKFIEQLSSIDKEKYIKELDKSIDLEKHTKLKEFILNNNLYITNIKTGPIKIKGKDSILIVDNSKNKWFILCVDGKICLLAKKNVLIHTDIFEYSKRDAKFNSKYKIKKANYLIEYVENIGANLSLNISEYNDKIGKNKWPDDIGEIQQMSLHLEGKNPLNGYTYNNANFSFCSIGKNFDKQLDLLI